jgi:hypothetical protein
MGTCVRENGSSEIGVSMQKCQFGGFSIKEEKIGRR